MGLPPCLGNKLMVAKVRFDFLSLCMFRENVFSIVECGCRIFLKEGS